MEEKDILKHVQHVFKYFAKKNLTDKDVILVCMNLISNTLYLNPDIPDYAIPKMMSELGVRMMAEREIS